MIQLVAVAASVLLLGAYAAHQAGRVDASSVAYAGANLVASATLAVVAVVERQWGFLLLEGAWAGISATKLLALARPAGR